MKGVTILIALLVVIALGWLFIDKDHDDVMEQESTEMQEMDMEVMEQEAMQESGEAMEAGAEAELDLSNATGEQKTFDVDGFNFGYSLSEIKVNEGDIVTINFTSSDGFHDWVVDEFDAATAKIQTGGNTSVTFVADKKGSFEFYCSVGQHRANGMVGTLVVE